MSLICRSLIVPWYLLPVNLGLSHSQPLWLVFPSWLDFWIPSLPHGSWGRLRGVTSDFISSNYIIFPFRLVWKSFWDEISSWSPNRKWGQKPLYFWLFHQPLPNNLSCWDLGLGKETMPCCLLGYVSYLRSPFTANFNFHFWLVGNISKSCSPSWGKSCFFPFSEAMMVEKLYKSRIRENELKIHL